MDFTHEEISFLMRSITRSMNHQTERERVVSQKVYDKLSAAFVETMDPEERRAVARAMDHACGDFER